MIRNLAPTFGLAVVLGLATVSYGQTTPYGSVVGAGYNYGAYGYASQPYGGFGLEYSLPMLAGTSVMDQYGFWHETPAVAVMPSVVAPVPAAPRVVNRSGSRRGSLPPRYRLPTGSLEASGANGGILYSPGVREQTYGYGFGYGPYGVVDNSNMWKGWSLGN